MQDKTVLMCKHGIEVVHTKIENDVSPSKLLFWTGGKLIARAETDVCYPEIQNDNSERVTYSAFLSKACLTIKM